MNKVLDMAYQMAGTRGHACPRDIDLINKVMNELPDKPLVVQLGAGSGTLSLAVMGSNLKARLISVDNNLDSLHWEKVALNNMGTDNEQIYALSDESAWFINEDIDLLIIDAAHTYENLLKDLDAYSSKLKHDSFIFVHDYDGSYAPAQYPGVKKACDEWFGREYKLKDGWSAAWKKNGDEREHKLVPPIIYQHKGMDTYWSSLGIVQVIHDKDGKELYDINYKGLHNQAEKLKLLTGCGYTPKLLFETKNLTVQEDLGESQNISKWTPEDWQDFRRNCVKVLYDLRKRNLRHGDLNGNNIIIKDKKPYLIDWQESHFIEEQPPQTNPLSDSYFMLKDIINWIGNPDKSDPYRICRRWLAILEDLRGVFDCSLPLKGKTLLDIGCFQGDFCAMAACEGINSVGVDVGTFRHEEDSILIGNELWKEFDMVLLQKYDIIEQIHFNFDIVLFMDTFPYLVREYGKENAISLLDRMVRESRRVYFETQMDGDKSGIEWLKTDDDIIKLVDAHWEKLETFPEQGIDRTLWRVTNEPVG